MPFVLGILKLVFLPYYSKLYEVLKDKECVMRKMSLFALGLFLMILVGPQVSFSDDEDLFESMHIVEIDASSP